VRRLFVEGPGVTRRVDVYGGGGLRSDQKEVRSSNRNLIENVAPARSGTLKTRKEGTWGGGRSFFSRKKLCSEGKAEKRKT